jgi:hypothetical protein
MSHVLELAKQGDPQAIAALINRNLNPQGINAKVIAQASHFKILLEGLDTPEQGKLTQYLIQGLRQVGANVSTLEIYGKRNGVQEYDWQQTFQLADDRFTPLDSTHPAPVTEASPTEHQATAAAPSLTVQSQDAQSQDVQSQDVSGLDQAALVSLAQTGNLDAIGAFVLTALADYDNLEAFVELHDGILKVIIQTQQFLDGPAFCGELGTQLSPIGSDVIREVEIYKQKSEKALPFLMKKVTLLQPQADPAVDDSHSTPSSSRPAGQSSAMPPTMPAAISTSNGSKGRPQAVTWIAILYFFLGALGFGAGALSLLGSLFISAAMRSEGVNIGGAAAIGGLIFLVGLLAIVISLGRIIAGIGLMMMRKWGVIAAFVFEALSLLSAFATVFRKPLQGLLGMAISIAIIKCLASPEMRERFGL